MARNIAPATVFDADASNATTFLTLELFEDSDGFLAFTQDAGGVQVFLDTDNFAAPTTDDPGADKLYPMLLGQYIQILE